MVTTASLQLGLEVIYGDTDSIMIDSGTQDLQQAQEMAQSVKAEVNKYYRLLEIDIDGIFKTMQQALLVLQHLRVGLRKEARHPQLRDQHLREGRNGAMSRAWAGRASGASVSIEM